MLCVGTDGHHPIERLVAILQPENINEQVVQGSVLGQTFSTSFHSRHFPVIRIRLHKYIRESKLSKVFENLRARGGFNIFVIEVESINGLGNRGSTCLPSDKFIYGN